MSKFHERLRALREERGLSQYEISNILKISRSTYAGYERENKEPTYEFLKKLADYFNCSIDYLVGYSDERHHPDVIIQKNIVSFQKSFNALPPEQKDIVSKLLNSVYMMIFRDMECKDADKLMLYNKLFSDMSGKRAEISRMVNGHEGAVTNPVFLSPLMELENGLKKLVDGDFDALLQHELEVKGK